MMSTYRNLGNRRRTAFGYWNGYAEQLPLPLPRQSQRRVYRDDDGRWRCRHFKSLVDLWAFEDACEKLDRPCYDPVAREWERECREIKKQHERARKVKAETKRRQLGPA